jgi:hypothetical protein
LRGILVCGFNIPRFEKILNKKFKNWKFVASSAFHCHRYHFSLKEEEYSKIFLERERERE